MPQDRSFEDLMAGLRTGDNDAATKLFRRYAKRLITLAHRRLSPQMRQKVDPEDVFQSAMRSFLTRQASGKLSQPVDWDNLWSMLVMLTLRKCGRRIEFFHRAQRDIDREMGETPPFEQSDENRQLATDEPSPAEAAELADTVEQLLDHFQGKHRDAVALLLDGHSPAEISARLECTERMVYRVMDRVKQWLERQQKE
jgi:RNA polymerase sigma-70 factor (ECF subfamily)